MRRALFLADRALRAALALRRRARRGVQPRRAGRARDRRRAAQPRAGAELRRLLLRAARARAGARAPRVRARRPRAGRPDGAAGPRAKRPTLNARAAERLSPHERCAGALRPASASCRAPTAPTATPMASKTSADACPSERRRRRRLPRRRWLPRSRQRSRRASPTALERCPNQPEDKDGFHDDDGCPDRRQRRRRRRRRGRSLPAARAASATSEGCPRDEYEAVEITPTALRIARAGAVRSRYGGHSFSVVSAARQRSSTVLQRPSRDQSRDPRPHRQRGRRSAQYEAIAAARRSACGATSWSMASMPRA